jgi:hypothetical protein
MMTHFHLSSTLGYKNHHVRKEILSTGEYLEKLTLFPLGLLVDGRDPELGGVGENIFSTSDPMETSSSSNDEIVFPLSDMTSLSDCA